MHQGAAVHTCREEASDGEDRVPLQGLQEDHAPGKDAEVGHVRTFLITIYIITRVRTKLGIMRSMSRKSMRRIKNEEDDGKEDIKKKDVSKEGVRNEDVGNEEDENFAMKIHVKCVIFKIVRRCEFLAH